jgi:hypothetical protein
MNLLQATKAASRALSDLSDAIENAPPVAGTIAPAPHPTGARVPSDDASITHIGRNRGTPLRELSDRDLAWYRDVLASNLADPGKARYHASDAERLNATKAEQARRAGYAPAPETTTEEGSVQ